MKPGQDRSAPSALGSAVYCLVFNLFRHRLTPDLFCAAPQDYPVPSFLHANGWSFAGTVSEAAHAFVQLNWQAAVAGARLNGYYLFQSCPAQHGTVKGGSGVTPLSGVTADPHPVHCPQSMC